MDAETNTNGLRILTVAQLSRLPKPPITLAEHVKLASEVTGRPISERTVLTYARESRPSRPGMKVRNRYEHCPMPLPYYISESPTTLGGKQPVWLAEDEEELREWWAMRRSMPRSQRVSTDGR